MAVFALIHRVLVQLEVVSSVHLIALKNIIIPPNSQHGNTNLIMNIVSVFASLIVLVLGFVLPKLVLGKKTDQSSVEKKNNIKSFQFNVIGSALIFTPTVLSFMVIAFGQGVLAIVINLLVLVLLGLKLKIKL